MVSLWICYSQARVYELAHGFLSANISLTERNDMKPVRLICLIMVLILSQYVSGCILQGSSKALPSLTPEEPTVSGNTPSPMPFSTPGPTPTSTLSIQTLSPQEANQVLLAIYEDNGGCQLPCYWRITPGETLWQDASAFLSSVGQINGPGGTPKIPSYGVVFIEGVENPIGGFTPIFWVENRIVKAIGINSGWVRRNFDYSLSGLLRSFGVPEEIWIRAVAESMDPFYYLVLMYPSKGILVNLLGDAEKQDQQLVVCPQDIYSRSPFPPQLLLWNPKEQVTFDNDFGKRLIDDDLGWVMNEYRLLQEVASDKLTNAEFYKIYSEPNTDTCMNVLPVR